MSVTVQGEVFPTICNSPSPSQTGNDSPFDLDQPLGDEAPNVTTTNDTGYDRDVSPFAHSVDYSLSSSDGSDVESEVSVSEDDEDSTARATAALQGVQLTKSPPSPDNETTNIEIKHLCLTPDERFKPLTIRPSSSTKRPGSDLRRSHTPGKSSRNEQQNTPHEQQNLEFEQACQKLPPLGDDDERCLPFPSMFNLEGEIELEQLLSRSPEPSNSDDESQAASEITKPVSPKPPTPASPNPYSIYGGINTQEYEENCRRTLTIHWNTLVRNVYVCVRISGFTLACRYSTGQLFC